MKGVVFSTSIVLLLASTVLFSVVNAAESVLPKQKNREAACTVLRARLCAATQPNTCTITPMDCGSMQQSPLTETGEAGRHATLFFIAFAELLGIALFFVYDQRYNAVRCHSIVPMAPFSFSKISRPLLAHGLSSFRF